MRFSKRTARGKPCREPPALPASGPARLTGGSESSDRRKTMASLFAASRQHFAASRGLHARAKAMRLVTAAHLWLKRAFRQSTIPQPRKLCRFETCSVVEAGERV